MAELRDDLRFAARLLLRSPLFAAVAILSLALAIGANTAIFSVVNGVLLRPLPFQEPQRLYQVVRHDPGRDDAPISVPQYAFLLRQPQPFAQMAAWPVIDTGFNLSGHGPPERIFGARVTPSFFGVLGVPPMLGRDFLPEEGQEGGPPVVVLGYELWKQHFGGAKDIIGRSLVLDGEERTIVGVMPAGFKYPHSAQLWMPLWLNLSTTEDTHYLEVVGRLNPEAATARVGAEVKAQGEQLRASRSGAVRPGHWLDADELHTVRVRPVRTALLVLLGAVGLVLLIACLNLANLQLARATRREREMAVRIALGASPARLLRQLFAESLLVACVGGLLGLLLAVWALPAMLAQSPEGLLRPEEITVSGSVLLFTLGVSLLAGLLFGLLPAWHASRKDPRGSLLVSAFRASSGAPRGRIQWVLVVGQVALAVILLVGASLAAKSYVLLRGTVPGFNVGEVRTVKLSLSEARYGTPAALETFARSVTERLKGLPGVQAVGFALTLPLETGLRLEFSIQGRPAEPLGEEEVQAHYRPVTHGYFEALKIDLVRGRLVDDLDRSGSAPVAVINEAAARRYWPGQDPIGQRIRLGTGIPQLADPEPREIIGVVRDVRERELAAEPQPVVYVPLGQMPPALLTRFASILPENLLIRSSRGTEDLVQAVRRAVWEEDRTQPVKELTNLEATLVRTWAPQRGNTMLMGLMAGLALALAGVGIYGMLIYRVNQRAREMGVRLALGATRGAVVWLVLRHGLSAVGVGVGLGLGAAVKLARLLDHSLYSASELDPVVLLTAPAVLVVVALLSMWLPVRRASRVDPMVSLRAE
jgi:putative ABC transport system permease protein